VSSITIGSAGRATPAPATSPYRGADRRASDRRQAIRIWPLAVAGVLIGAVAILTWQVSEADPALHDFDLSALNALLATACAVFALVAGYVSGLRWRMVGDASSLRGGAGLVVLGTSIVVTDLVARVDPTFLSVHDVEVVAAALTITAGVLFVSFVFQPQVDSRLSMGRIVLVTAATFGVSLLLVQVFGSLTSIRGWGLRDFRGPDSYAMHAALVGLRVAIGVVALTRGLRSRSMLWTWFGMMFFGFAVSYLLRTETPVTTDIWYTGGSAVMLIALLCGLYGVSQELKRAYMTQRSWLFDVRVDAAASEARRRAERADSEERAHQARSAVLALQAATRALEQSQVGIDDSFRQTVRDAIETEIDVLRRLVAEPAPKECEPFDVAAVVSTVALTYRVRGAQLLTSVAPGTWALGRPNDVVEVLQVLLDNAGQHAEGSVVRVWSSVGVGRVEIRVDDRGQGVDTAHREDVFERSATSSGVSGRGLGLFVARRLMREQQGDLWVEPRAGGGASFVLSLPALADSSEETDQRRQA
jgi:signal transduction histidine kinase